MFEEVERVKERRRQRMQTIMLQNRDALMPHQDELHDIIEDPFVPKQHFYSHGSGVDDKPPRHSVPNVLALQTVCSLLLIGSAYLLFRSPIELPLSWKEQARFAFTEDFRFTELAQWYEGAFGKPPTILPVLTPISHTAEPVSIAVHRVRLGGAWEVLKPFDTKEKRVVLQTEDKGEVVNSQLGWVASVEEKEGMGKTVLIHYSEGRDIWYGNLDRVHVAANDLVRQGDLIGMAQTVDGSKKQLIITVREKDQIIDPMDVISLE